MSLARARGGACGRGFAPPARLTAPTYYKRPRAANSEMDWGDAMEPIAGGGRQYVVSQLRQRIRDLANQREVERSLYKRHVDTVHNKRKDHACPQCDYAFHRERSRVAMG